MSVLIGEIKILQLRGILERHVQGRFFLCKVDFPPLASRGYLPCHYGITWTQGWRSTSSSLWLDVQSIQVCQVKMEKQTPACLVKSQHMHTAQGRAGRGSSTTFVYVSNHTGKPETTWNSQPGSNCRQQEVTSANAITNSKSESQRSQTKANRYGAADHGL